MEKSQPLGTVIAIIPPWLEPAFFPGRCPGWVLFPWAEPAWSTLIAHDFQMPEALCMSPFHPQLHRLQNLSFLYHLSGDPVPSLTVLITTLCQLLLIWFSETSAIVLWPEHCQIKGCGYFEYWTVQKMLLSMSLAFQEAMSHFGVVVHAQLVGVET